jgi:replicative DNA helicase
MGATWAVAQVSNGLKRLANASSIPVLALAQLNRSVAGREDKRPSLADLRQSGDIEQHAEAVMLLCRPEYYVSRPSRSGARARASNGSRRAWRTRGRRGIEVPAKPR